MKYRNVRRGLVGLLTLLLLSVSAAAAPVPLKDNAELKEFVRGAKVIKSGRFSQLDRVQIKLRDGTKENVPQLAKKIFAGQSALKTKVGKAKMAKFIATDDYGQETKDYVVLTRSTTYLVDNPKRLAKAYPSFPKFGGQDGSYFASGDIDVSKLSASEKSALRKLKKELAGEKASHPLRKALKSGGDAALLAAALNGAGEVTIRRTVLVPKLAVSKSGELNVPVIGPSGVKMGKRIKGPRSMKQAPAPKLKVVKRPLKLTKKRLNNDSRRVGPSSKKDEVVEIEGAKVPLPFVTGFTESHGWTDTTTIGGWALKAKFTTNFGFYFGIRVPLEMSWKISPAYRQVRSARKSGADEDIKAKVTLTANPSDQEDDFYKKAGMPKSKIFHGRELVSGVWANVKVKLYVLGTRVMNKTIGITEKKAKNCDGGAKYCFQYHLQPPWKKPLKVSEGGKKKNFKNASFWLPSSLTKSTTGTINLGLAKGKAYANVGLKLGGSDTKVKVDYRPVVDGQVKSKKTMTFTPNQSRRSFSFNVPKISSIGESRSKTKTYGFKLSNPRYKTTITGTPGIKLTAKYKAAWQSKWKKVSWSHFFNGWRFDIFTAELGPHAGTKTSLDCSHCAQKVYKSMKAKRGMFGGL